ncbi:MULTISPECIES: hypothetical protein [Streptomyces]|uniref:hypothetical protein n=1 Tax=Streptomyces TaxID=1883 RepID=UPI001FD7D22D|nr:hypothetical protein [Streptomyces sp. KCTC 0041BP]
MAELLVDVVERIVVPVTALPCSEEGEPSTEMFALETLRRVLVTSLRMWAQAGPEAAEGIACAVPSTRCAPLGGRAAQGMTVENRWPSS